MTYKTIKQNCTVEIVEKKSRFICQLFYVQNKQEAEEKINQVQRQYYDSKHNCFAYRIYDVQNDSIITKMSDDGEPSGTAGAPILAIINTNELINVLAIVTRYFGGTLLGTGGLVRSYQGAVQKAVEASKIYKIAKGTIYKIEIPYSQAEKLKYICNKSNIHIKKVEYCENVIYWIEVNETEKKDILNKFEEKKIQLIKIEANGEKMIILG